MHVTAFAVVALFLCRRAYRIAGRPSLSAGWPMLQASTVFCLTGAYGLLAGASLPTVRTVAMVALALALRVLRRHALVAEVLGASALLLAATDPLGVTSAGFWLSFAAVAALLGLVVAPGGAWQALRQFVRAQAAVSAVLAPVLLAAFGGIPVAGPLVNAVAIPLFSLVLLPATLAGTALLPLAPGLAAPLWSALGSALDRCWPYLQWAGQLPAAVYRPPAAPGWLLAGALAATLAAVIVPGRSAKSLAAVMLAALLWRPAPAPPEAAFELTMLDVGHGLAVVVRTRSRVLVFDTGPRWRGGGTAARATLVPYLRWYGIGRIDVVVVSHPDADHAGGLAELAEEFRPGWVIGDAGAAGGVDEPCIAGRSWEWDGVTFTVIHPPGDSGFHGNDGSCAVRVSAAGGAALLLADPEARAERAMLGQDIGADVVVVPHHGSDSSSTPALVAASGARWALISSGYGNRWGLPRATVVQRWSEAGARVLTTAEGGALSLRVGPGAAAGPVEGWRAAHPRWWRRP
jgi:competence protein ComEC